MAEVVGLVASVLTLGKLAYKTCHGIRSLHELLGELPDRLALLSNEVDDAKVVLYGLHGVLRQREEMGSEADDDDHFGDELRDDVALHVTKLRGHLEDLQEIVAKIHTTSLESPMGNARRAIAWKRYHGRLNDIQDRIVAAKSVLRTSMDSASLYVYSSFLLFFVAHARSALPFSCPPFPNSYHILRFFPRAFLSAPVFMPLHLLHKGVNGCIFGLVSSPM
jgi:hypothetical protein